jgi:hypothetical protein
MSKIIDLDQKRKSKESKKAKESKTKSSISTESDSTISEMLGMHRKVLATQILRSEKLTSHILFGHIVNISLMIKNLSSANKMEKHVLEAVLIAGVASLIKSSSFSKDEFLAALQDYDNR